MNIILLIILIVFGAAALLTMVRIVIGPSILDRTVASDVLLTEVMCALGAEMAFNGHTRTLPVMLIIAAVGVLNVFDIVIPEALSNALVLGLVLAGALLCLSAAIGLLRFRDVPSRLHAATKPQVLGVMLICLAIALSQRTIGGVLMGLLVVAPVVLMQFATAPLSAHMVGRQAYRNGTIDQRHLVVDEYAESKETPPAAG
jgi:multicomponent Na+:H+ antiporter subunit G